MPDIRMARRIFLKQAGGAGLAICGLALGVTACGGDGGGNGAEGGQAASAVKSAAGSGSAEKDRPCDDLSGLTAQEKQTRKTFAYESRSEDPAKYCDICNFWKKPPEGEICGGCTLVKGPIHPKGTCNSWAPIQEESGAQGTGG